MLQLVYLHILMILLWGSAKEDYWSADYDTNKNCLQEEKIIQLENKVRKKYSQSLEYAL